MEEVCGVAPRSNLKQCIRLLASRLDLTSEFMALGLVMKDEVLFKTFSLLVINRPVWNYQNSYTWRIMEKKWIQFIRKSHFNVLCYSPQSREEMKGDHGYVICKTKKLVISRVYWQRTTDKMYQKCNALAELLFCHLNLAIGFVFVCLFVWRSPCPDCRSFLWVGWNAVFHMIRIYWITVWVDLNY